MSDAKTGIPCPRREGQAVPDRARRLPHEGRPGPRPLRRQGQEPAPGRPLLPKAAAEDHRTADWSIIADIDFLPADSEVDALLMEARLVKDIQPRSTSI